VLVHMRACVLCVHVCMRAFFMQYSTMSANNYFTCVGQEGYVVYKMFHHGKYRGVIPYLVRRGLENRGAMLRGVEEQTMLRKEIARRIFFPFK